MLTGPKMQQLLADRNVRITQCVRKQSGVYIADVYIPEMQEAVLPAATYAEQIKQALPASIIETQDTIAHWRPGNPVINAMIAFIPETEPSQPIKNAGLTPAQERQDVAKQPPLLCRKVSQWQQICKHQPYHQPTQFVGSSRVSASFGATLPTGRMTPTATSSPLKRLTPSSPVLSASVSRRPTSSRRSRTGKRK